MTKLIRLGYCIVSILFLSACNEENNQATCIAPTLDADSSFFQDTNLYCYSPKDIHDAYQLHSLYDMGLSGQGRTIILLDAYGSDTAEADLITFHEAFFPERAMPEFKQIILDDSVYDDDWAAEIALDVQWAHAIALDAAIHLIMTDLGSDINTSKFIEAVEYIINNYESGTLVSMSFGERETYFSDTELNQLEALFAQGTEQGITFFAASGDAGSQGYALESISTPSVIYPTASPYVTSVGGTFLQYGFRWNPLSNN
ncbi:hypothetical protein [uncultured Shewanella sp.]|uniref:hypothetical protein n=1 Tax=uncultured Shewanella sp. TaxID=173975 RepID=UPI0026078E12|nr:hypothetical protein [uncultured Shewanella sp.]